MTLLLVRAALVQAPRLTSSGELAALFESFQPVAAERF